MKQLELSLKYIATQSRFVRIKSEGFLFFTPLIMGVFMAPPLYLFLPNFCHGLQRFSSGLSRIQKSFGLGSNHILLDILV